MNPRFHRLRIAEVRRETPECVSLRFELPPELAAEYRFTQGQHLSLRTELGGEELRRSYSICAGIDDGELRVAVKKVAGGLFSEWVNEKLAAGDASRRICGASLDQHVSSHTKLRKDPTTIPRKREGFSSNTLKKQINLNS